MIRELPRMRVEHPSHQQSETDHDLMSLHALLLRFDLHELDLGLLVPLALTFEHLVHSLRQLLCLVLVRFTSDLLPQRARYEEQEECQR